MTIPLNLPTWLPWWVPTLILVPVLLYALVFILMPFSVVGVKGRLETLDARLDEIQSEIRSLALRLPEPLRGGYEEPPYASPPVERPLRPEPLTSRPPIPPAPLEPGDDPSFGIRRSARARQARSEPRLDWPRS